MTLSFSSFNAGALFGLVLLSGCAAPGSFSLFPPKDTSEKSPSPAPEADTCPTPEKCTAQLRKMIKDGKRDWIGQPQSPDVYSNGTRLFAYRALRKKLTCSELERALAEFKIATPSLQPVRYFRVRTLLTDVARELKSEEAKRCPRR